MSLRGRPLRAAMVAGVLTVSAAPLLVLPPEQATTPERVTAAALSEPRATPVAEPALPLAGKVVVIDPGHQLGNRSHLAEIGRLVPAGGFEKACNTTGTATGAGYPEATFVWQVARALGDRLEALGARLVWTRQDNSAAMWGPCVDERGRAGGDSADLKISLHADGRYGGGPGFHVIAPVEIAGLTDDILAPSTRLAGEVRDALLGAGFPVAGYVGGGDGIDERSDLATLNLSDVPVVMAELGNMRDPGDVAWMTDGRGRARCARALATAVETFLTR